MPCRELTYASREDWDAIAELMEQRRDPDAKVDAIVRDILANVKTRGDEALAEYTRKFDCESFEPSMLRVPESAIREALDAIPAEDAAILEEAIGRIRDFHLNQKEKSWWTTGEDGTVLGQLVRPVDRVGLYVPGGQGGETPLISSLIMNAVPAQVAGVKSIAVTSPPRKGRHAQPVHPGHGSPARPRRNLPDRLRLGHRGPGLRHRNHRPLRRAGRAWQHLRGHGQVPAHRQGGHRHGGRSQRNRHPGGRFRQPRLAGRGHALPGRTRSPGRLHPGHPRHGYGRQGPGRA